MLDEMEAGAPHTDPGDRRKQAVVLIHGIGEQRPMDTLRRFVDTVWTSDNGVKHPDAVEGMWSKPDRLSGGFELRRLSTSKNSSGIRTDFYEFYWAHLMHGTRIGQVWAWIRLLFLRWPWTVPRRLRVAWILGIVALATVAFFTANAALPAAERWVSVPWWAAGLGGLVAAWFSGAVLVAFIGDAARYLHPAPGNIQARHEIRSAGVALVEALHTSEEYGRVIVVGHSLGSVIAYDVLVHAWPRFNDRFDEGRAREEEHRLALEALIEEGSAPEIQAAQRAYLSELHRQGHPWLVTDLVTLGSPLTHAALLLGNGRETFDEKTAQREFPTAPPAPDSEGPFTYRSGGFHVPHHAAPFAPTRWTNLYFPSRWILGGDPISGPLATSGDDGRPLFGHWVRDVAVRTGRRLGLLGHTLYWSRKAGSAEPEEHITALREALRLAEWEG